MNPIYGKTFLVLCCTLLVSVAAAPNTCAKLDLPTDPFSCCTIPKLLDVSIVSSCFEKFPIDPNAPNANSNSGSMPKTDCMSECILNGTGIYNRRGNLDEKKLSSVFTDSLPTNSPWLSVVRKAMKECTAKSAKKEKEFDKAVADQKKVAGTGPVCNPEASFLVDCIHTTVFSDCPSTLRSTTSECDTIWKFLKNCPFSALRQ